MSETRPTNPENGNNDENEHRVDQFFDASPNVSTAGTLPIPAQPYIGRVAVRAPPFWKENPALWFRQLESQFHMNGITVSETKYHVAVAALDTAVINQVSDVVMNPPAANVMYETLKLRLQERFAESEERRFKKLLGTMELGDKKPSHLWREMRDLGGARIGDGFLRSLWLQRLPAQIQAILSTDNGDIEHLLTMADRIHEVFNVRGEIQAVSNILPSQSSSYITPIPGSSSSTASDFQHLCAQVNELSQQLAALSSKNNQQSSFSGRGNRSRSRSQKRGGYEMCWYHFRFGKDAKKCIKPCNYKQEN